jgi:hypothetical protein
LAGAGMNSGPAEQAPASVALKRRKLRRSNLAFWTRLSVMVPRISRMI